MTTDETRTPRSREPAEARTPTRIQCKRTGRLYTADEHGRCPYCFGSDRAIESGDREAFCDFRPGVDPVSFGFPPDGQRMQHG